MTNIRSEAGDITTDPTGSKSMIKEYHKQINANKFDNSDEMEKPLERYKLSKLTLKKS